MKYVSVFYVIVSLLAVCVLSAPAFSSDEITPDEVLRIADQEKEAYFGMIAFDYALMYGSSGTSESSGKSFNTLEDAVKYSASKKNQKALQLGTPFRIYTIKYEDILSYQSGNNLSSVLKPTNEWLVPLEINGKARATLSVGFLNGKWQTVGIALGEFGENLKKSVPSEFMPGKGGKYVKIYPTVTDFVAVVDEGETKVMPLSHSVKAFFPNENQKDVRGLYRASDVISKIADNVRADIKKSEIE